MYLIWEEPIDKCRGNYSQHRLVLTGLTRADGYTSKMTKQTLRTSFLNFIVWLNKVSLESITFLCLVNTS